MLGETSSDAGHGLVRKSGICDTRVAAQAQTSAGGRAAADATGTPVRFLGDDRVDHLPILVTTYMHGRGKMPRLPRQQRGLDRAHRSSDRSVLCAAGSLTGQARHRRAPGCRDPGHVTRSSKGQNPRYRPPSDRCQASDAARARGPCQEPDRGPRGLAPSQSSKRSAARRSSHPLRGSRHSSAGLLFAGQQATWRLSRVLKPGPAEVRRW